LKTAWILTIFALLGCVSNPSVTIIDPNGATVRLSTGVNLMAEVDEQVSEVEGQGFHLRHMVRRQDATRVPIAGLQALVTKWLAAIQGRSYDLKTKTDGQVELGKQGVQKVKIEADLARDISEGTQFNPNIPLPIRK
jgi:hypothetical protein